MKAQKWLVIVLLLLLVNIATLAFLWMQYRNHKRPPEGTSTKDFVIKELALNKAQQLQYDTMRQAHQRAIRRINDENRKLHDRMFQSISNPTFDTLLLDSITKQIALLDIQKEKLTVNHFRQLRSILISEQQKKFDNILKQVQQMIGRPMPPPHGKNGNGKEDRNEPQPGDERPPQE